MSLGQAAHPVDCLRVKRRLNMCLSVKTLPFFLHHFSNCLMYFEPFNLLLTCSRFGELPPPLIPGPGRNKPETFTHVFLYPGTIAGRRHDQLDEAAA